MRDSTWIILKKLATSLLIFFVFVYLTVFLCSIPRSFTLRREEGKLTPSHSPAQILRDTNQKFTALLKLDLGKSARSGKSLDYLITETAPRSIMLLAGGMMLAFPFGILKGIFDSKRGRATESSLMILGTIIPISLPDILIIALLQRLAVFLNLNGIRIFRIGGTGTINHTLLPVLALSVLPACYIARIAALSIDNCYQQDFVNAAIGKGCSKKRVLWNHVMRNAIPAIIASLPTITAIVIGNLLMVEKVFGYQGLTQSLFNFFNYGEKDGTIASIILIGIIYFILDAAFSTLKWIVVKPMKEESL